MVVNPRSQGGVTGRRWLDIERRLRSALGPLEVERTRGPRDAERIAREGVRAGVGRIVVAGGDGTLGGVVTGLLAAGLGGHAEIGLLPLGTGGDMARSLGIPRDVDAAIEVLVSGKLRGMDAGRVGVRDAQGRDTTAYFANVASFGVSGLVVELVNRGRRFLPGGPSFLLGTLRALAAYRAAPVTLRVDGEAVFEGPLVLAAAANGRFFGGGMRVAPYARLDDGLLDVVVVPDRGKLGLLVRLPKLYRGTHLESRVARLHRGREIEVDAPGGAVRLELDGEPAGCLPARITVLPGAITLRGPAA